MCSINALDLWNKIKNEIFLMVDKEPLLFNFYWNNILQHNQLSDALSYILSHKLSTCLITAKKIQELFQNIYFDNPYIINYVVNDIKYILKKDPVAKNYSTPILYFKGFHALESYRISHFLWNIKKKELSMYLQSRISSVFSVDIHPSAILGSSIMMDHATGIVIGSSVIIEDNVIILQSVTLGSTGKNNSKNRHPKIRKGVMIGAGAKILGNIEIGKGSKIGAGSVVLDNIPEYVTAVGVPAKIIKKIDNKNIFSNHTKKQFSNIPTFQYGDGI